MSRNVIIIKSKNQDEKERMSCSSTIQFVSTQKDTKENTNINTNGNNKTISATQNNEKFARSKVRKESVMSVRSNPSMNIPSAKKRPKWKRKLGKFLDSPPVLIFMSILTLWALFASDIQYASLSIKVDLAFNVIQCILLFVFSLEFILNCFGKEDYTLSFFFWLDLIATISIIQDIDYIMNPIMGYSPITPTSGASSNKSSIKAAKAVAKVSSASRATRVLRVIRIVRLIRMVKLYKSVYIARENAEKLKQEQKKKMIEKLEKDMSNLSSSNISRSQTGINTGDDSSPCRKISKKSIKLTKFPLPSTNRTLEPFSTTRGDTKVSRGELESENLSIKPKGKEKEMETIKETPDDDDEEELIKESKISKIVTESITKKVIVLILTLLIIFPLLSDDFYADTDNTIYSLLSNYIATKYQIYNTTPFSNDTQINIYKMFDEKYPPVNISINNIEIYNNPDFSGFKFRYKEIKSAYSDDGVVHVVFSVRKESILTSELNLGQTLFVCLCLTLAALTFENDATSLVLEPLEVMTEIVEKVAKDPMGAKNIEEMTGGIKAEVQHLMESEEDEKQRRRKMRHSDNYEVQVVKGAIVKISALLAIGFGEAGGEIIQKNLSSGSELNPRLRGKKKTAIFGFCDIHDFNEINLALEERTMLFVNEIAEIVHSSVDRFRGATNKNIGDAFLSVWKFYNDIKVQGRKDQFRKKDNLLEIDPTNIQVGITADCSVLAFLRIILKINKNLNILAYRKNPEILKRIKNYKLEMGFGLHMGYGIEGAVGSTYKIDASYLSPNVNIAARLESASRQFGVSLLISGVLYQLLTDDMKEYCRFIDCVTVKGSELPLDLYTIDINYNVTPQKQSKILILSSKEKRALFAEKKEELSALIDEYRSVTQIVMEKQSYRELIKERSEEFLTSWENAIKYYREGNWVIANSYFKVCAKIDPSDGPTKTLMGYINRRDLTAPKDWNGVRELTSK